MYCTDCGALIDPGDRFCETCGATVEVPMGHNKAQPNQAMPPMHQYQQHNQGQWQPYVYPQPQYYYKLPQPGHSSAVGSLICGILAMVIPAFGIILSVIAIVQSKKARVAGYMGVMPTVGLVLGIIGLISSAFSAMTIYTCITMSGC